MLKRQFAITALLLAAGLGAPAFAALAEQPSRRAPARPSAAEKTPDAAPTAASTIRSSIETTLTTLGDHMDFARARRELETAFDQTIAYSSGDAALLRDAAFALRLVSQLGAAEESQRKTLYPFLRAHDALARTLVFLVKPEDSPAAVYDVLARLHAASEKSVTSFPSLAAAICVVHDVPIQARAATREHPRTIDPVAIFDYYVRHANQMVGSPRTTAPELLIHVVDSAAEIHEMRWALSRHGGDRMVHKRYNDLVYDTAHFKQNKPKKIADHAYTLENLRKFGGVCEEQAYFASHIAKATGTPSIYISGRGSGVSHAWVGVLLVRGTSPAWYLEEGRYDEYKDLRGTAEDPQTRKRVPDDQIALSARVAQTPLTDRHTAQAYIDAARRVFAISTPRTPAGGPAAGSRRSPFIAFGPRPEWPPPIDLGGGEPTPTSPSAAPADDAMALKLLEQAAKAAPALPAVWLTLADAAAAGRLGAADRVRWFEAFYEAVGADHPDYCFGVLSAMITPIEDGREQAGAWDWVIKRYHQRKDLCTQALIGRGDGWQNAGNNHEAYLSYIEAVNRYSNDAPEVLLALGQAERLLRSGKRDGHIVEMYKNAFQRTRRPSSVSPAFFRQSNFYRIGDRYATLLERSGRATEARSVRNQLRAGEDKD